MKHPYPLVEVVWLDAETSQGWEDHDDTEPVVPQVISIGFLMKESASGMMLAMTCGADKTNNNRLLIPRGMVKSVRYLRGKPKVKVKPDASP